MSIIFFWGKNEMEMTLDFNLYKEVNKETKA